MGARRAGAELAPAVGKMSRRDFLRLGGVGIAGATLLGPVACGGQTNTGANGGGTLVVGRTGDIDTLDPHIATAFTSFDALELVYDSLLGLDPDKLTVVPGLAEDFQFSNGGRTLTLTLRKGLSFHDGTKLTSDDVKASLERILDEKTGAAARSYFLSIDEVAVPDETTIELRLSKPDASLPTALTSLNAAIVPRKAIEAGTIERKPNGSGAFVYEDWTQGQSFTTRAFEDYWDEGPYLAGVDIRVIPDESSVVAGMQAQNFQLGILTDPSVLPQARRANLNVEEVLVLDYHGVMLNGGRTPLDDVRVRKAIACAIDRQQVIDSAAFGEGKVTGPITSPAYQYSPTAGLACDPPDVDHARTLLEEAGYADGIELNTIVMTGQYATAVDEAQSLKSQLQKIGVTLNLEQLETNVYVDRWIAADFDAAVVRNGGSPDPDLMYDRYFSKNGTFKEVAGYSSDTLENLMTRGVTETDPEVRKEIYADLQRELLEASPWVWVFRGYEYRVLQDNVEGFVSMEDGSLRSLKQTRLR